jgi:hypothetical protein
MKRFCCVLLLLSLSILLLALPVTEIRRSHNIRFYGNVLNDSIAGNWVFWSEPDDPDGQLMAMRYNNLGYAMFGEPLCISLSVNPIKLLQVEASSDGNVILFYQTQIGEYYVDARIQKINASGQFMWQNDGILVGECHDYKFPDAMICANNIGGAYAVYHSDYGSDRIYQGVNLDNSGNNIWTAQANFEIPQSYHIEQLLIDSAQNLIINIARFQVPPYIFKVDSTGNVVGSYPMFDDTAAIPYATMICPASDGRLLLYSKLDYSSQPLQLQMVDTNGSLLYDEPLEFFNSGGYITNIQFRATPDGGFFGSSILDSAPQLLPFSVIAFRLNANLEQVWGDSLNVVYGDSDTIMDPYMLIDAEGNCWISCIVRSDYTDYELKLFKVDALGSVSNPSTPISADTQMKECQRLICLDNLVMIVWKDYQGDQVALKRQIFDPSATALLPQYGLPINSKLSGTARLSEFHSLGDRSICIWSDDRGIGPKLYYQVLDEYLNPIFMGNGIEIPMDADDCSIIAAAVSPQNTLTVVWKCYSDDGTDAAFLQEIDSNGNLLYPGNGILIGQNQLNLGLTISFDGNARLIYWIDYYANSSYRMIVKGQKIESGEAIWGSEGITIYDVPSSGIESVQSVNNYLLIKVEDSGTGVNHIQVLSLQADGSSSPGWPENGITLLDDEHNSFHEKILKVGVIGDDLFTLVWRFNVTGMYMIMQKVSATGELLWGNSGLTMLMMAVHTQRSLLCFSQTQYMFLTTCPIRLGIEENRYRGESAICAKLSSTGWIWILLLRVFDRV